MTTPSELYSKLNQGNPADQVDQSQNEAYSQWLNAINNQQAEAYRTNPNLFRPTYIGDESGYRYASPQTSNQDLNVIIPALQKTYRTPENYQIESYKFLEKQNPNMDYNPQVIKTQKQNLLNSLYPQMKA